MALELKIKPRSKAKPRALRRQGVIPATLYGPEIESTNVELDAKEFSNVPFRDYTHLINLVQEGQEAHEVLIKNIQRNYVTREVLNIEFYKVMRGHKLTMHVALKYVNDSPAVKLGADLVRVHKEISIKCLPRDIPYFVEVDISKLKNSGDFITFADLEIDSEKIEVLNPPQEIICKAETKRKDHTVEPEPAVEAEDAAAEGEKKDSAEGAEAKSE